jgi:hypothetical protein
MFVGAIVRHGKTALTGSAMTIGGFLWQLLTWVRPTTELPAFRPWVLWVPGLVVTFGATFVAWRDESDRADRAEDKLKAIRDTRPKIVFDCVHHESVRLSPPDAREVQVWQLWFQNRPAVHEKSTLAGA